MQLSGTNQFRVSFIILFVCIAAQFSSAQSNLLKSNHIRWDSPSNNAGESMPLVGGDIGCNVWVENGDILVYVQRSGSIDENGEYLKMGRFRVTLYPNPFRDTGVFRQELVLENGFIEIEAGKKALVKLWVDVYNPVVHVDIESAQKTEVTVAYENWRTLDKDLGPQGDNARYGAFGLQGYPGSMIRSKDHIEPSGNSVLFYHRNPERKLFPDTFIELLGLEEYKNEICDDTRNRTFGGMLFGNNLKAGGISSGAYQGTPFQSWRYKSKKPAKKHGICVAMHIEQAETIQQWKHNLSEMVKEAQEEPQKAFDQTCAWWNEFWKRSYIFINPGNPDPEDPVWQAGRNYQLFRYQLGGNTYGEYPTKFNGGNLIFDSNLVNPDRSYGPDWRQWGGGVFTAQNQRLLYWPMLKSGDFEAMIPQFELYRKGLAGARARVKKHFKHEGAVYPEYANAAGLPYGDGWGWPENQKGYRVRGTEVPFGDPRVTAGRGYNDFVEEGVMANGFISYHWESQVEHAYMILEYHRFSSMDISAYMPFIEQSLVFFDQHYRARQKMRNGKELDDDGKLVLYPSTACETYRGAKNPVDLIAGLKACLSGLLELDEKYLSPEKKVYYQSYLNTIPDYSYGEKDGARYIKPAVSWTAVINNEQPELYPLFPFNRFKLGDEEMPAFKKAYEMAGNHTKSVISWHQNGIQFARMGMAAEAAEYNIEKLKDSPRRYPTFWGPGYDWVPDHNWGGTGMLGLQEMLMQTIGDKIVLFPAWPQEWNVDFKLHAPRNTTVEGKLRKGKLILLTVTPSEREKDIVCTGGEPFEGAALSDD